ncbi:trafficking protein particle complex subunit 11-like [Paramacrobiotus metropolitanus]|uniref:trafficking protein particle complex subunit 11-like n=1 Tax=Paramacrobiotus metropolitanus TaxID=2943436 RepID=UPI002445C192|nr:trafficking protein particle complex subunit 11-like [Paramacrobiotus metropolitanus]
MNPPDLADPLFNVPPEVLVDPVPFVALCGLDVIHNATHRLIWDAFASNRSSERLPVSYRDIPADHEFPVSKVKKSYEYGTVPNGILKSNWIKKHLYEVPSLVVLFVDLEWDDPAFAEKKIACSSKVATIRASLAGRNSKIALVLIQSRPHTFAQGEPSPDAEKITGMCNACELAFKQLFLLPNNENLAAYVVRLETALFDTIQGYYLNEAKRVRGHRDAVMRMQSQNLPLLVRHQFKMGYFNEFRQDRQTALKHYQQAYQNLQQIRQDGGFEVKTVAMIIVYRICRLSFRLNCPVDAITSFRKHLDIFRTYKGPPELAYQHEAWLFRQNFLFAILFEDAIRSGLAAIPSENPGMYYTKAANHMKLRQQTCLSFPPPQIPFQPAPPVDGEFYGQLILSVPSSSGDMPVSIYLQNCERAVNHTSWMIHLLGSAVSQFKKHRCARTALMLFSRIGDEYCDIGLYDKAQVLYSQGLNEYRKSKWSVIFSQLLLRQIKISALMPNVSEFIKSTLEAIGAGSFLQFEDRTELQETLLQILSGNRPDFRSLLGSQSQIAYQKWGALTPENISCSLDMDPLLSCIEHECAFDRSAFEISQMVSITVKLTLTTPLPMQMSELQVTLSNPAYNGYCCIKDGTAPANTPENRLYLVPNEEKLYQFQFPAVPEDVGKHIDITKLILKFGSLPITLRLVWSNFGKINRTYQAFCNGQSFKVLNDDAVSSLQSVDIERRPALAVVQLPPSALILVGETYRISFSIVNKEQAVIRKPVVGITCDDPAVAGKIVFGLPGSEEFVSECSSTLPDLSPDSTYEFSFLIRCSAGFKTSVRIFLSYDLTDPFYRCLVQGVTPLESTNPLQIRLLSKEFNSEEHPSEKHVIPPGSDMVYLIVIKNASPVKITLGGVELKMNDSVLTSVVPIESHIAGLQLLEEEEAQEAYFLHVDESCTPGSSVLMGPLILTWNRTDSDQNPALTYIPVPDMLIKASPSPLKVFLDLPASVTQFEPLGLVYRIHNCSDQLLDIHAFLSTNDEYVLAGEKEARVRLGPRMETSLHSSIIPINVGYMRLPEFEINSTADIDCREWIDSHIPKTIFVMPKDFSNENCLINPLPAGMTA